MNDDGFDDEEADYFTTESEETQDEWNARKPPDFKMPSTDTFTLSHIY